MTAVVPNAFRTSRIPTEAIFPPKALIALHFAGLSAPVGEIRAGYIFCDKYCCSAQASALHRPGGQAGHQIAPEHVINRGGWQRVDEARGHQQFPRRVIGGEEIAER